MAVRLVRALGVVAGTLALVALFSLGLGVERYLRWLAAAMQAYGMIVDVAVGWLFDMIVDGLSEWLVAMLGRFVRVGDHWKHVFTIVSLYVFADSFQFFRRPDAPRQDPAARRRLPISNEWSVGLVSVGAGFTLGLAASVVVGLTPLDRSFSWGLVTVGAVVLAIFLYWILVALAHARWNRWNYAQRVTPMEPVELFAEAFRKRAVYAARRSLVGGAIGLAVFLLVLAASPAPAPGLVALGAMALALGVFWIWRAFQLPPGVSGLAWSERLTRARRNGNFGMGCDMTIRVLAAALVAALNAVVVGG